MWILCRRRQRCSPLWRSYGLPAGPPVDVPTTVLSAVPVTVSVVSAAASSDHSGSFSHLAASPSYSHKQSWSHCFPGPQLPRVPDPVLGPRLPPTQLPLSAQGRHGHRPSGRGQVPAVLHLLRIALRRGRGLGHLLGCRLPPRVLCLLL